ncbi:hypothetical protein GCM10009416_28080 [Craurococcus roseus]|uniref:Uncharacterized protein n=1 Tax=Craurococcus roseus TaxID=77585 RepID=A0ABN1FCZ0_9PROT
MTIPGASHPMNRRNPEAFNAAVLEFWRRARGLTPSGGLAAGIAGCLPSRSAAVAGPPTAVPAARVRSAAAGAVPSKLG